MKCRPMRRAIVVCYAPFSYKSIGVIVSNEVCIGDRYRNKPFVKRLSSHEKNKANFCLVYSHQSQSVYIKPLSNKIISGVFSELTVSANFSVRMNVSNKSTPLLARCAMLYHM